MGDDPVGCYPGNSMNMNTWWCICMLVVQFFVQVVYPESFIIRCLSDRFILGVYLFRHIYIYIYSFHVYFTCRWYYIVLQALAFHKISSTVSEVHDSIFGLKYLREILCYSSHAPIDCCILAATCIKTWIFHSGWPRACECAKSFEHCDAVRFLYPVIVIAIPVMDCQYQGL